MKKPKKAIAFLLSLVIISTSILPSASVFAKKSAVSSENVNTIIASIYNNIKGEYIVENTKIPITPNFSIEQIMGFLVTEKKIYSYSTADNALQSLTSIEQDTLQKSVTESETDFYLKKNGEIATDKDLFASAKNGDIYEWIYSKNAIMASQNFSSISQSSKSQSKSTVEWTTQMTDKVAAACGYLTRNLDNSSFYLISLGIAGKPADVKKVNTLQSSLKSKVDYKTPMDISRTALASSFCGFNASLPENGQLISRLSAYPDIMKAGIFGAVNTLLAYDSNPYDVADTALNSRTNLIANILPYQNSDGGFCITTGSVSDIDTTAMTITALSPYRNNADVEKSVQAAVTYLSNVQTKTGGFGFKGQENLESLSTVIIALSSLNIDLNDKRFNKGDMTLLENLLSYQQSDGGFAHVKSDATSSSMPTEQAIIALCSVKKRSNPYVLSKPIEKIAPTQEVTENKSFMKDNAPLVFVLAGFLVVLAIIIIVFSHKFTNKKDKNNDE